MTVLQSDISQLNEGPGEGVSQDFSRLAREVLRVRLSMLLVNDLIKEKAFRVPIHLALGHEAIAVAVSAIMQPGDRLALTHRNIHYNLARSSALRGEIDEYLLRGSGQAGGRDGAMNLTNPQAGIIYTSSILGNCLPVACGIAMGQSVNRADAVTIATTGDGALEEGAFYETLMMANSLKLPMMIVVENNEWSMHTRIDERRCAVDLAGMAAAFGMELHRLGGNDVEDYVATLQGARAAALKARKPRLVEVALSTLGDCRVPDPAHPNGRYVNYHHGAAAHLSLADGALIEASERDPVHALARRVPASQLDAWADEIRGAIEADLA